MFKFTHKGEITMEKWEYSSGYLFIKDGNEMTNEGNLRNLPDNKKDLNYPPTSFIDDLNKLGNQGWELVYLKQGNIFYGNGKGSEGSTKGDRYFYIFKRKYQE
jgi:hypothetical protein